MSFRPGNQEIRWTVPFLDAATGAPLSRVLVADVTEEGSGPSAVTGPDGGFELVGAAGRAGGCARRSWAIPSLSGR